MAKKKIMIHVWTAWFFLLVELILCNITAAMSSLSAALRCGEPSSLAYNHKCRVCRLFLYTVVWWSVSEHLERLTRSKEKLPKPQLLCLCRFESADIPVYKNIRQTFDKRVALDVLRQAQGGSPRGPSGYHLQQVMDVLIVYFTERDPNWKLGVRLHIQGDFVLGCSSHAQLRGACDRNKGWNCCSEVTLEDVK